jgi:hypothetical protein
MRNREPKRGTLMVSIGANDQDLALLARIAGGPSAHSSAR